MVLSLAKQYQLDQCGLGPGDLPLERVAPFFVLGTNPEANLLVEIYQKGGTPTWRYALFPMTIYSLEAKLDNKTVWNKPEALIFNNFSHPHFAGPYRGDSGGVNIKSLLP